MNIIDLIKIKFPTAILGINGNVSFQDHGDGNVVLGEWNVIDIARPTKEEIESWMKDSEVQEKDVLIKNEIANQSIYKELDEIDFKSIRALREEDIQRLAVLEEQAVSLRAQLLPVQ
jgi:hypothetical protein